MRRIVGLAAVGLVGVAVAVVPALGANADVNTAPGNTWSPSTVTVTVGDTVTFRNPTGGNHNLQFSDRAAPENAVSTDNWTVVRQFDQPGTYGFFCVPHQTVGMVGQVVVNAASSTGTTTTGPTDTTPTTTPTTTTTPITTAPARPALGVRLVRRAGCNRRSKACPRPGVAIRVSASEALTVSGPLRRRTATGRFASSGRVRVKVSAGRSTLRLRRRADGSLIGRGSYRLTLTGARADGTTSGSTTLRFSVRG